MRGAREEAMRSMRGMFVKGIGTLVSALLVSSVFSSGPVFAQESVSVRAHVAKGPVPAEDPNAAAWSDVPVSEFPLSPQVHWPTRILEVTAQSVKVRALHDGQQVAMLLAY